MLKKKLKKLFLTPLNLFYNIHYVVSHVARGPKMAKMALLLWQLACTKTCVKEFRYQLDCCMVEPPNWLNRKKSGKREAEASLKPNQT